MSTTPPQSDSVDISDAVSRLLASWREEIQASQIYEILAQRQSDPKRAEILRKLADAEGDHRRRIEQRLTELGVPIPDPGSVRLPLWRRLQAQVAPMHTILLKQEEAEEAAVETYGRPTGDPATDTLLAEILTEEDAHERQLESMRLTPDQKSSGPQRALDRIMGREAGHARGSSWISGAIYGANDGLASVFGIVSYLSGATGGSSLVLTAGIAGALASALSMATGAFLAERSENEVRHANLAREREEIEQHPEEEKQELSLYYQLKGLSASEADELAEKLSRNPAAMLTVLSTEELGISEATSGRPLQAAIAAGISTGLGAIIPVLPFFWLDGTTGVVVAAMVSIVAHFIVGAAKSLMTMRSWFWSGMEMTVAGIVVGVVTYLTGLILPA